ncbi:dendritic cell-specific transmembrane protein [Lampris incognitus]|uniref:dendritic cell-specific transmembrane protein n=1 Tax=Lampris incognitus TaxID=2546036 RepID=UPI0024B5201F|nr:dendritic cell-specific transmembrane protein [Lampris incognitus]
MVFFHVPLRQSFKDAGSLVVDVYTTVNRGGLKRNLLLLLTCSLFSLLLSSLLLLYLLCTLSYATATAGGIAGCFGMLLTAALFLSKRVRCIGVLFVVSCFTKKSRSLLLTAGASLVVIRNFQNTLENMTGLVDSMICNLQAKRASIVITPLDRYLKMLKWVGDILEQFTDFGVVKFSSKLEVSAKVESEGLREKLAHTQRNLVETAENVRYVVNTVSSVCHRMYPAISFLLLMVAIALHVKKYCNDMNYVNTFISSKFIFFDERQKLVGKPHVLPLTPEEAKVYISIPSSHPTTREGKAVLKYVIPVFSQYVAWIIILVSDALTYYFVGTLTTQLSEQRPFNVSMVMNIMGTETIIGIATKVENHRKDFSYSFTLFEKKCLPKPKLLLSNSIAPLAVILTALMIMSLMAGKLAQLRLMVCECFFSSSAERRVEHLHAKILRKRSKRKEANADESDLRSLIFKPHFWCPLLFRPREDAPREEFSAP